jgi:hypothetical protein
MPDKDPLAERLNKLAEAKAADKQAETSVAATQEEARRFLYENARPEYERVKATLQRRIDEVNPQLTTIPQYSYNANQSCVIQGNVAAYLTYAQLILNAGSIYLRVTFGAQPNAFYIDRSYAPTPENYTLQPAVEQRPLKIVWVGDLGQVTSDALVEFVLQHLTEYYLDHQ